MAEMSNHRPSITGWLLSRPLFFVQDTVRMARSIATGAISLPGRSFYGRFLLYLAIVILLIAVYFLVPYKLKYNHTPSEAIGWYLIKELSDPKTESLRLGRLYSVSYECPKDTSGQCIFKGVKRSMDGVDLLKRVQGLPGQTIQRKVINGKEVNVITGDNYYKETGEVLTKLKDGTEIPSLLDASEPITIPKGYVYVGNQRVRVAFDSRYFGLVPISKLTGLATKL